MMRKSLKIVALILAGLLVLAQFFQPDKNSADVIPGQDMLTALEAPGHVADLLKNSCYDCHSNHTRYPWYNHISPVSWLLWRHVEAGKEALNFNEFDSLKQRQKIGALTNICEHVESHEMPLKSYLLMHGDAKLDEQEVKEICDWTELETEKIISSPNVP